MNEMQGFLEDNVLTEENSEGSLYLTKTNTLFLMPVHLSALNILADK
jgi:hypothetical protein